MPTTDFANQVMSQIGQRAQARLNSSIQLNQQNIKAQSDALWTELLARDPNDPTKSLHSDDERQEIYDKIQGLYPQNKGAKSILDRAKPIIEGAHKLLSKMGGGSPGSNPAMAQRAAGQAQDALSGGQGGSLVSPPQQPDQTDGNDAQGGINQPPPQISQDQAQPQPYTPPAAAGKLPVQQVAAGLPSPPQRSIGRIITGAGSPEANVLISEAARAKAAQKLEEMKATSAEKVATTRTTGAKNKLISDLAKQQLVPVFDDNGEYQSSRPMSDAELSQYQKNQTTLVGNKADTEKHKQDLEDAKGTLAKAQSDYNEAHAKSLTDPNTPMNQKILEQLKLAQRRMTVAEVNVGIRGKEYLGRYYGTDEQGNPLPGAVADENGLPVGSAFAHFYAPTAATLTKAQAVPQIEGMANRMIAFAQNPANEQVFGKEGGLRAYASGKIGTNDPRLAGIGADIESLASFLTTMHGARGAALAEGFKGTLRNVDSPEAFSQALREYAAGASMLESAAIPNQASKSNPAVGPGSGNNAVRKPGYGPIEDISVNGKTIKARRNLKTGKYLPE